MSSIDPKPRDLATRRIDIIDADVRGAPEPTIAPNGVPRHLFVGSTSWVR
jgi:hypothetical protein